MKKEKISLSRISFKIAEGLSHLGKGELCQGYHLLASLNSQIIESIKQDEKKETEKKQ